MDINYAIPLGLIKWRCMAFEYCYNHFILSGFDILFILISNPAGMK